MKVLTVIAEAPTLKKLTKKDHWAVATFWECKLKLEVGVMRITIREGWETDLASIPRLLRGLVDNGSGELGVLVGALVHDALYSTHYLSKETADKLFLGILRTMGVKKARIYYLAVKLFGKKAWDYWGENQAVKSLEKSFVGLSWLHN